MALCSINPTTAERIREYPEASAEEVAAILSSAATASRGWHRTPISERAGHLRRAGTLLRESVNVKTVFVA